MRPGDYCKPKEEDRCDCDSRGTIPNTQCDANTLQCQCKVSRGFHIFCLACDYQRRDKSIFLCCRQGGINLC